MADGHKSRRFKDLRVGDLFTYRRIIFTKLAPGVGHLGPYNAISDTTTGSKRKYFASNAIVEKLDE